MRKEKISISDLFTLTIRRFPLYASLLFMAIILPY